MLQALANIFATRLRPRRLRIENESVFSNVLADDKDSIFFLKDWHGSYLSYTNKIKNFIKEGACWIGEFDLAAYYDTIAHELLLKTAFQRNSHADLRNTIATWFNIWSAESRTHEHGHGIPQGPIASDFLADCFLLPIDEKMGQKYKYLRYVDDICLFGKTRNDVHRAVIELEILCRNRGLIPQAKKVGIRKISTAKEIQKYIPSIGYQNEECEDSRHRLSERETITEIRKSLGGRPLRIQDKTRARYALYHGKTSSKLRRYLLPLLLRHPEHIDALLYSLGQETIDYKGKQALRTLVEESPYQYVRGEALLLLAAIADINDIRQYLDTAVSIIKNAKAGFSEKYGACALLCKAERLNMGKYSKWAFYQHPFLQALIIPEIPGVDLHKGEFIHKLTQRSFIEPGLALAYRFVQEKITLKEIGIKANSFPIPVRHVYKKLGLTVGPVPSAEPIAELLQGSIGLANWDGWRKMLKKDYRHAAQYLNMAAPVVKANRSLWLIYQNSFNQIVFMAIQEVLAKNDMPGRIPTRDPSGKLRNYGNMLAHGNSFFKSYPSISKAFYMANKRRNRLPEAHAYSQSTGEKTKPLGRKEQDALIASLKPAFEDIRRIIV